MLHTLYAASASRLTSNSRRLRHLPLGTDHSAEERAAVIADIEQDIKESAFVNRRDFCEMLGGYADQTSADDPLHVCGACGVRDPDLTYHEEDFAKVPDNHWVRVDSELLASLDAPAGGDPYFELTSQGGDEQPRARSAVAEVVRRRHCRCRL